MGEVQDCYGGFRHKDICPLLRRYRQVVKKGQATVASAGLHEAMVGFLSAAFSGRVYHASSPRVPTEHA